MLQKKPESQPTNIHHILKEVKVVQQKIQKDVARLAELKVKTEGTLKEIQNERQHITHRSDKKKKHHKHNMRHNVLPPRLTN